MAPLSFRFTGDRISIVIYIFFVFELLVYFVKIKLTFAKVNSILKYTLALSHFIFCFQFNFIKMFIIIGMIKRKPKRKFLLRSLVPYNVI